ncbi:hypothetical protein EDB80DRAFT_878390 [Ilyonectria destructans]|nr:hypothetical protein EDB80DRAFT_878390 [Ilyonectria destructans]
MSPVKSKRLSKQQEQRSPFSTSSQHHFTMDSAMGQFRGVDRLNATTIVPSRDVVARKQSLIVAAAMGGFIFAVITTVVVFMAVTYRAQRRRRNQEVHSRTTARTTASDTNANV